MTSSVNLDFLRKREGWLSLDTWTLSELPQKYYSRTYKLTSDEETTLSKFHNLAATFENMGENVEVMDKYIKKYLSTRVGYGKTYYFNISTGEWQEFSDYTYGPFTAYRILPDTPAMLSMWIIDILLEFKIPVLPPIEVEDSEVVVSGQISWEEVWNNIPENPENPNKRQCFCCAKWVTKEGFAATPIIPLTKDGSLESFMALPSCKPCRNNTRSQNAFEYLIYNSKAKPGLAFLDEEGDHEEIIKLTRIMHNCFYEVSCLPSVTGQLKKELAPQRSYAERMEALGMIISGLFRLIK